MSVKSDITHPLTDALTFLFFLLWENVSATSYQRPQSYIMKLNWASTAIKPHLQYQHSILQIIHSLLWILKTIRALPSDWGNGSIWAFQTHSQGAVLVLPVASLAIPPFIRQLAEHYLYLRSKCINKESAFTSTDRSQGWEGARGVQTWSYWVGQECLTGAKFYFGVGPLQEQSQSVWHYGGHPNG